MSVLLPNSGPHIVEHLRGRVESLTNALERAQDRIGELERAFGSDADLMPLMRLGLTPSEARVVHLVRTRELATGGQIKFAIYADDPDRMTEVNADCNLKVFVHKARKKLRRLGLSIETVGRGEGASGYRMPGPDKQRLAKLIATGARSGVSLRPQQAAE